MSKIVRDKDNSLRQKFATNSYNAQGLQFYIDPAKKPAAARRKI